MLQSLSDEDSIPFKRVIFILRILKWQEQKTNPEYLFGCFYPLPFPAQHGRQAAVPVLLQCPRRRRTQHNAKMLDNQDKH